jgi:hypothetical protein
MTKTVKFLGNFVYQADLIRPRHRTPERFDVVSQAEYELPVMTKADLVADAVVVRVPDGKGRLDHMAFDGWNGALWSPLGTVTDDHRPTRAPTTLMDYRVGFRVNWLRDSLFHSHTDPLRRAYARELAPTERGRVPQHAHDNKTTVIESDLAGTVSWSNRSDALRRHLDAARDLIVVDDAMYVRRDDPVWAVSRDSHGRRAQLTIPKFWISSDSEVMPKSYDDNFLMYMDVFRADRAEFALRGGIAATGEIISLDARFLSRDDDAWTLFCRLGVILTNAEVFFRTLPTAAVVAMKTVAEAFNSSSMWRLGPISERKQEILACMETLSGALASADCPPRLTVKRDYALKWLSDCLSQCGRTPGATLHPDDEACVASLADGA